MPQFPHLQRKRSALKTFRKPCWVLTSSRVHVGPSSEVLRCFIVLMKLPRFPGGEAVGHIPVGSFQLPQSVPMPFLTQLPVRLCWRCLPPSQRWWECRRERQPADLRPWCLDQLRPAWEDRYILVKGRRPISGRLALHLTANQGEFCQKAGCSTVQGHGRVLAVSMGCILINGTGSPSAVKPKG